MTEQIEAQRPAFIAWWTASGRDPAWCSQRADGSFNIRMVEIAFDAWIAAKADQVEVTDEMVERGQCAWRNHPLPVSVGGVHALEELEETDREMMRTVLSAALNPPSPQGTEANNG